jgi:hypothetical protein
MKITTEKGHKFVNYLKITTTKTNQQFLLNRATEEKTNK